MNQLEAAKLAEVVVEVVEAAAAVVEAAATVPCATERILIHPTKHATTIALPEWAHSRNAGNATSLSRSRSSVTGHHGQRNRFRDAKKCKKKKK